MTFLTEASARRLCNDEGPHSAHRNMRSACGNETGAGAFKKLLRKEVKSMSEEKKSNKLLAEMTREFRKQSIANDPD